MWLSILNEWIVQYNMRTRKPGRLGDIAAAARSVFIRQGYRLTQMADVAREAGVSAGALYSYVAGKEALLELALAEVLGQVPAADQPFTAKGFRELGATLGERLRAAVTWPELEAAIAGPVIDAGVCDRIVGELFDLVSEHRHLIWLLDRCAGEVPELSGQYEAVVRGRYIADFTTFVGMAPVAAGWRGEAVAARARALMEMTVWMGMHRRRDRRPPDVSEAEARAAALGIARAALLPMG